MREGTLRSRTGGKDPRFRSTRPSGIGRADRHEVRRRSYVEDSVSTEDTFIIALGDKRTVGISVQRLMASEYRKEANETVWHFCSNCSTWQSNDFLATTDLTVDFGNVQRVHHQKESWRM